MILDEIAEKTRMRVAEAKKNKSLEEIKAEAEKLVKEKHEGNQGENREEKDFAFENALRQDGMSFICEVKKASPSKGVIAEDFDYIGIAKEYERAGATAISVLTEPFYFLGNDNYLMEIKQNVSIPVLRKDFTVDEYMIYEAKIIGADCILLIAAILSDEELKSYLEIAGKLNLSAIVEAHDKEEVERAKKAGASIIGVNNRDLRDFTVDINNSVRLRKLVDKDIVFISESGIKTAEDIKRLHEKNVNGVLIGETLMRSRDKKKMLDDLKSLL